MIRKLAFALSLLGACFTGLVHALGLGEAAVQSSLNQPLSAEIELVNVSGLGVDEILPGLATREEFLRAKVDRVYFLSDLRFKVVENEKGNLAVLLTTTKPVREPFLNFLVEVIWPSGRLLREYALLIDPPLFNEEKAKPVLAPTVSASSVQTVENGDVLNLTPSKRSVISVNTSEQGSTYGATDAQDTLWDIAIKARPDRSVTPQQVMLSIQDLNPTAFINQNINKLKTGQVLRLPSLDQIKQRNRSQAINEVIAQNEADRPKRTKSITSSTKKITSSKVHTPRQSGDELKLVVASNQSTASDTANSGQSSQAGNGRAEPSTDMIVTLEKLDKAALENTELNSRVVDLEEQLQTLQRILALKNDQLANIQGQMRANELAKLEVEPIGETETDDSQNAQKKAPVETTVESAVESVKSEEKIVDGPKDAEAPQIAAKEIVKEKVQPVISPDVSTSLTDESENIFDMIINNPLYLGLLVIGVLVLLMVLWLVSRNNGQKEQEYYAQNQDDENESFEEGNNETLSFDETDDNELASEVESTIDDDVLALDDENFADEVEPQQEQNEEDVMAEADVYIAYGRLDQAASILEEAISADPVRTDYRLKLLEVYKDSNDVNAFNRQFSELEAIQDVSAIEEASEIRAELLENELVSIETKEQELSDSRQLEDGLESQLEQEAALETEEEAIENDAQSFDFDSVDESIGESGEDEIDVDFSSEELELDLDVDLDLVKEGEPTAEEKSDLEFEAVEFSPELEQSEETDLLGAPDLSAPDLSAVDLSIDEVESEDAPLDLDDIDLSGELDQETEIELSEDLSLPEEEQLLSSEDVEPLEKEGEIVDLEEQPVVSDAILDEAVEAFGSEDDFGDELGDSDDFDFLEGADEASTKLDLARAYIDMGDVDGAKDILEEVAKEGSDDQQSEAKDLLGSLGA